MQVGLENHRNQFFPEIAPHQTGALKVSDLHSLYYEEVGNPAGHPVVFLHGGPGGGCSPKHRRFFDPDFYRIVLFDQRGAGKSTPHAELRENTTWDLMEDIEKLRNHLGIDRWLVFGGSWGSTLALAYAVHYPQVIKGLILRGIFLCRQIELQWFYQQGASLIYPDHWEQYLAPIPEEERHDMITAYYKRLTGDNEKEKYEAALAWSGWEASTAHLIISQENVDAFQDPKLALAFARIECHYFYHRIFWKSDDYLINRIQEIRHIPCHMIHGRYDVICPMHTAWELHRAWPEAHLNIVQDAGHSAMEDGIRHGLIGATEDFKKLFI